MKFMKLTTLGAAVLAIVLASGMAGAAQGDAFTISGGSSETIVPTTGDMGLPVGTTGYSDALLTIGHTRAYKFEFLGCGDAILDNRFYLRGSRNFFACSTSKVGDSFIANMKVGQVGPHSPFHFQSGADINGPSIFNGEGPFTGTYTNDVSFSNVSIFYAIDGSTGSPGMTSGNAVLLGFADGGNVLDNDHQDLVIRISLPNGK